MAIFTMDTPVSSIMEQHPGALDALTELGLDTCCGADLPFAENSCRRKLDPDATFDKALAVVNGLKRVVRLDVRDILRRKEEPFEVIMKAVNELEPEEGLLLLTTFEPKPLIQVMARKGYTAESCEIGDGDWQNLFVPEKSA